MATFRKKDGVEQRISAADRFYTMRERPYLLEDVVEAEQFFPDQKPWPEGVYLICHPDDPDPQWAIGTWKTVQVVIPGDWIITLASGERRRCDVEFFQSAFEPVT